MSCSTGSALAVLILGMTSHLAAAPIVIDRLTAAQKPGQAVAPDDASHLGSARTLTTSEGVVAAVESGRLEVSIGAAGGFASLTWSRIGEAVGESAEEVRTALDLTAEGTDALELVIDSAAGGAEISLEVVDLAGRRSLFLLRPGEVDRTTAFLLPFDRLLAVDPGAEISPAAALSLTVWSAAASTVLIHGPIAATSVPAGMTATLRHLDAPAHLGGAVIGGAPVAPGATLTLSYTLTNNGGVDATGVQLDDPLDPNLVEQAGFRSTPIAFADSYPGCRELPLVVGGSPGPAGLLANDVDLDGGTISAVAAQSPTTQGGTVVINDTATGTFTYSPAAGYQGPDTFSYTVEDDLGNQSEGAVTVDVGALACCGNAVIEGGETCDGADLGGETCASQGFDSGTLACDADCQFDLSGCDIPGLPFGSDTGYTGYALTPAVPSCDDISATGTPTLLTDDSNVVVSIGFTFPFYGVGFTEANIQSNGTLRFGDALYLSFSNTCLPTATNPSAYTLYVFWDDLNPSAAGEVYSQTLGPIGDRRFVVQWDVPNFGGDTADLMRFQAMLHEATGMIEVCYVDTINAVNVGNNGAEATSGIQQSSTDGFHYSCNTPGLVSGLQLLYLPN